MINKPLYLDIHALQSVPPSCINRDDTGSPKTARFGGVLLARVSSQAWKKAIRDQFAITLDATDLGQRTQYAVQAVSEAIRMLDSSIPEEDALKKAKDILEKALNKSKSKVKYDSIDSYKQKTLLFIGAAEIDALARLALDDGIDKREISKTAKQIMHFGKNPTAIDIALFGRMVATDPVLNVDAAAQVAHALGIGNAQVEFDYFTALDDRSREDSAGAGHINTTEYLSAIFYRYATVDVYHLYENLGSSAATQRAIEAFCTAFVRSMPTGKQNTFANRTLPAAVIMQLRDTQPVSLVNAFERPVYAQGNKSQTQIACERLVEQERFVDEAFGTKPQRTFAIVASPDATAIEGMADEMGTLGSTTRAISECVASYLSVVKDKA